MFDAINDIHDEIQAKLLKEIETLPKEMSVDYLTEMLFHLYQEVNQTGLLSVILTGELELLMRRLPEYIVKEHLEHDNFSMEQFFSFLPLKNNKDAKVYSGAFRGIFLTMLYQREIGETIFDDVMKLLIRGLIIQIQEGEKQ